MAENADCYEADRCRHNMIDCCQISKLAISPSQKLRIEHADTSGQKSTQT